MDKLADILAVSQLVYWERHWRDKGQWENMRITARFSQPIFPPKVGKRRRMLGFTVQAHFTS